MNKLLTSTKLLITIGKIERGNLNMLNRLMQTNAVRASSLLFSSMNKKVVKEIRVTYFRISIQFSQLKILILILPLAVQIAIILRK